MGFLLNQILSNSVTQQEAVNTARDSARASEGSASQARIMAKLSEMETDRLASENRELKLAVETGDTSGIIKGLRERNEQLTQAGKDKDAEIARQKDVLRQWMISQTAFKNLFKRYGVLPDGRKAGEMPDEERKDMVAKESEHVVETGDGVHPDDKKFIMGGK